MAVQWLLVCHGMVTLTVVISFLCGQWPIFKGTPFQWIHYFITFGAYDYFLRFVGLVFGSKGTDVIMSVEYFCCERPNPILQVIYIAIIGSTYFLTAKSSFIYIPGYYIGDVHKLGRSIDTSNKILFKQQKKRAVLKDVSNASADNIYSELLKGGNIKANRKCLKKPKKAAKECANIAMLQQRPLANYMELVQRDIDPDMRKILIDWLVESLMLLKLTWEMRLKQTECLPISNPLKHQILMMN